MVRLQFEQGCFCGLDRRYASLDLYGCLAASEFERLELITIFQS
jgi:hypothetical protein